MNYNKITKPTECRLIVAMADIACFGKACQGKSNLDTFRMLDEFYHLIDSVVTGTGGKALKFIGDAALMVFPGDHAKEVVALLQSLKKEAQAIWTEFDVKCTVCIKAHIGSVVCGPMGAEKRFDVIGDTLNELFRMPDGHELSDELKALVEEM